MKTKSGILTTLFSLILLLAGVFLIASNYVVLPSFLDGIKELATANIALSGGEKALMVPGIFLVAEAFMILISRRKKPYSLIFAFYLFFVYFTLIVFTHLSMRI